ncbi:MAG TPA: hydroxymethylbilane synthase [Candidatus Nanopelagicales bacterium]|nr:hydroxymethylbilane synthase [Candidatus Nanopelagicales bacterium]
MTIRIATRGSLLARTQSGHVADSLRAVSGREVELVHVRTHGDADQTTPLASFGGVGVFVTAVRDAVLRGEADVAVHSLKDLPTQPAAGLEIAAIPLRQDPRDVLVARDGLTIGTLPEGARVGTGSPRRAAQLLALRPDLDVVALRGNVDTRVRAVTDGDLDAVILARAGLARLDRLDVVTQVIDVDLMLPAPAQGALAVECRDDDVAVLEALRRLDDAPTRAAVTAERALLAELEAGCSAPVGAHATVSGSGEELHVHLTGTVVSLDGREQVRNSVTGRAGDAEALGRALARDLLAAGAPGLRPIRGSAS